MWIFLSVLAFLILLIAVILFSPIYILIKTDELGDINFGIRFLGKLYSGSGEKEDTSFSKLIKRSLGISNFETKEIKKGVKSGGIKNTVSQTFDAVVILFREVLRAAKRCKATKLEINIVCGAENAGDAAMNYGIACAAAYPAISFLESIIKVSPRGKKINISCDFERDSVQIGYNIALRVRVFRVLAALIRVLFGSARREIAKQTK